MKPRGWQAVTVSSETILLSGNVPPLQHPGSTQPAVEREAYVDLLSAVFCALAAETTEEECIAVIERHKGWQQGQSIADLSLRASADNWKSRRNTAGLDVISLVRTSNFFMPQLAAEICGSGHESEGHQGE